VVKKRVNVNRPNFFGPSTKSLLCSFRQTTVTEDKKQKKLLPPCLVSAAAMAGPAERDAAADRHDATDTRFCDEPRPDSESPEAKGGKGTKELGLGERFCADGLPSGAARGRSFGPGGEGRLAGRGRAWRRRRETRAGGAAWLGRQCQSARPNFGPDTMEEFAATARRSAQLTTGPFGMSGLKMSQCLRARSDATTLPCCFLVARRKGRARRRSVPCRLRQRYPSPESTCQTPTTSSADGSSDPIACLRHKSCWCWSHESASPS
jgi:hypothetical protein